MKEIKIPVNRTVENGRSFDIDGMLYEDTVWLAKQVKQPIGEFKKIVEVMELSDKYVDKFWDLVSIQRNSFTFSKK
ncbi:MAG: hypothetical protein XD93_0887 [candidate division WS6 bacterium 34_10]|uniref:Uncharacterized protein n=1 Tax=candidate division WS6 bacterium 34_10 TaxID=1641389 RepID=A0A101HGJ7_9BACT|nr:MAG: hypothetical protein XD93_0887 [candidate division WS6 bacterium 34_10]